ncbi:MAG: serine/threonine-protein kinase [Planctomycetota bacterium]|jgi:serine/threonine-protein kinase|nr:serine/threonine-protein kinase [Planctomycetota bacterium]MEE3074803.1 serine/threonine-protein kinase [Planctomycetota bacterium]
MEKFTEPEVEDHDTEHQRAVADVLSSLTERLQGGESIELSDVVERFPNYKDELTELWPLVMLTEMAGENASPVDEKAAAKENELTEKQLPTTFGDFELIEEIGRGGMGVVYRARQQSLGREVALKLILLDHLASETDRARFYAEARAAAKLEHPHIVPVYDLGDVQGRPYISMKLIEGSTLSSQLQNGHMDGKSAAKLLIPLCQAVQYAHENSVLHRDVKPSNIMINHEGQAFLTDFGLAKDLRETPTLTRTGAVVGTPAYMPPEQASGQKPTLDPTSDVYSLGAVLYHMITGQPPFVGRTGLETVLMVMEQDPPSPRSLTRGLDRDLEMIILRCLQKPPDLRYASASALEQDLNAYLNNEEIAARSGRFSQIISQVFRETHHFGILENWGLLWMWHSVVLLIVCVATSMLYWMDDKNRLNYFLLWTVGLGAWAAVFWAVRRRMGPVTFVERQIAHLWAGSMICVAVLFPLESWLGLEPLKLSPMLPMFAATTFLVKGAILSGRFYFQAIALFATPFLMAAMPGIAHLIFGVVAGLSFFIPGYQLHKMRSRHSGD